MDYVKVHMAVPVPVPLLSVALTLLVPNNLDVWWKIHTRNDYSALNLWCVCSALSSLTRTAIIKCGFRSSAITSVFPVLTSLFPSALFSDWDQLEILLLQASLQELCDLLASVFAEASVLGAYSHWSYFTIAFLYIAPCMLPLSCS